MTERAGPDYQRLIDVIRARIAAGEYPVGGMIPSTAALHEMTGLSVPVVRRAVGQLEADGILEGHPGKGVYVKATPAEADRDRQSIGELSGQVADLQRAIGEMAERADKVLPADFASEWDEFRATVGRLEANVINLYGKLGYEYPHGGAHDAPKAAARRGRSGR